MFCESDGGGLHYDENYVNLVCEKCGRKYNVIDLKYRMDISEEEYKEQEERNKNIKGKMIIGLRGVNSGKGVKK